MTRRRIIGTVPTRWRDDSGKPASLLTWTLRKGIPLCLGGMLIAAAGTLVTVAGIGQLPEREFFGG